MRSKRRFCAGLATTVVALSTIGAPTAFSQVRFDLPAQPLSEALKQIALQAGVNIYFDPPVVKGITAPHLNAQTSPGEAISKLLAGTTLRAVRVDQHTFRVVSAKNSRLPSTGASKKIPISSNRSTPDDPPVPGTDSTSPEPSSHSGPANPTLEPLEEIVVTAEKVKEREIDVPVSMTVLSARALSDMGASQFSEFASAVPGLSFTSAGPGFTQISLRGVTTGADVSSTVGIYLDDVPIGSSTGFAQGAQLALDVGLFDINRIDVLRGPQGTLYGANSMGGLLKYVTYDPNPKEYSVYADAAVSDTQDGAVGYKATSTVNLPLVHNKVALRATGFELHDGGFIDNTTLGTHNVNRSDIYGGRLDILFAPTAALSVRISGLLQDITRDGLATANYTLAGSPITHALQQQDALSQPFSQKFRLVSSTVSYSASATTITSISAYQAIRSNVLYDYSRVFVPEFSAFGLDYSAIGDAQSLDTKKFTQELRLASQAGHSLEWIIGAYYDHETSSNSQNFVLKDLAGAPAPNNLFSVYSPSRYNEYAGFGDVTVHLTPKASLTGGIRYSHNDQSYRQDGSGILIGSEPTSSSSASVTTYLANGKYAFSRDRMVYARYATGYRPGGPNFAARDPATGQLVAPLTFKADRLSSYEIGTKSEYADRRLTVDADAYDIEWHDIQVLTSKDGFAVYANGAGARIQGAELTAAVAPTDGVDITAGVSYQHAYLTDASPDLGGGEGERLPNVPRLNASVSAEYRFPNGSLSPAVGGTLIHVSDRTSSFSRSTFPNYKLPAYTTLNLHGSIRLDLVVMRLYVDNLLNTRGQLSTFQYTASSAGAGDIPVTILRPRTVGLDFSASF